MSDKNQGYIKLHRAISDWSCKKNPNYMAVWIEIMLSANHSEAKILWNGEIIYLKPGQFIGSYSKISKNSGVPKTNVTRILRTLKAERQVEQQSFSKYSIFTVLNWEKYQEGGTQSGTQAERIRNAGGTQAESNKNDKNKNNEKNEKNLSAVKMKKTKSDSSKILRDRYHDFWKDLRKCSKVLNGGLDPALKMIDACVESGEVNLKNIKESYLNFLNSPDIKTREPKFVPQFSTWCKINNVIQYLDYVPTESERKQGLTLEDKNRETFKKVLVDLGEMPEQEQEEFETSFVNIEVIN